MFRIGEFSRMSGISVNTLYHYDSVGILHPTRIDEATGYRFYEASQLAVINKILAFKDAGFALQEIADILNRKPSEKSLITILEKRSVELEEELQAKEARLGRLHTNIFLIKNGALPLMNEITIKKVEPILGAAIKRTFSKNGPESYDSFCERIWSDVNSHIKKQRGRRIVPCMTLYHRDDDFEQEMEVVEPLAFPIPASEEVRVYELPALEKAACAVHIGPFSTIPETYGTMYRWVKENGYSLSGPIREIYHKGDWATDNPKEYVTELQFPIE